MAWQHADAYNRILHHQVPRNDPSFSWHVIWLYHEGYVGFPHESAYPLPAKDPRATTLARHCNCAIDRTASQAA